MAKDEFQRSDGMNYAPKGIAKAVCEEGEFCFAAVGLDHGHIYGMCNGLIEAGGTLTHVFDPDPAKVKTFKKSYPDVQVADSYEDILAMSDIKLIACAAIPSDRADIGIAAMRAGKDYFADKAPVVSFEQLENCRRVVQETGQIFAVYFSERLHVEGAVLAGELIAKGEIGRVIHMDGFGPHRLSLPIRPDWFFDPKRYGGILCDIGCHQIEQFLYFAGAENAKVDMAITKNYNNPKHPDFEDFGQMALTADNGATAMIRLDWFTPDALPVWGDGRTFIVGTEGYIEIRKYLNIATQNSSDHVFLCNKERMEHIEAVGKVGFPFFGALIRDCLDRTHTAMPQEHVFTALNIALKAQDMAD